MFAGHTGCSQSLRPLISQTSALDFFPIHLLHLVAFAVQNTDYHSIFIIISRGAEAELFGASDLRTWVFVFSHT